MGLTDLINFEISMWKHIINNIKELKPETTNTKSWAIQESSWLFHIAFTCIMVLPTNENKPIHLCPTLKEILVRNNYSQKCRKYACMIYRNKWIIYLYGKIVSACSKTIFALNEQYNTMNVLKLSNVTRA